MLQPGERVAHYEIVTHLRSGGMAALYLARRVGPAGFARDVAIKLVHPHLAEDESFRRMFVDEARLSARIVHPNVVHVEELGEERGRYFLVMEYVHGASLSQILDRLRRGGQWIDRDVAVRIAIAVAEGLHAAHETRGDDGEPLDLVHRDVSPSNVLVTEQGHVKLIDFGIAKARGRAQETESGVLKGKTRYMSPEQARGERIDRRTDVFALGIVLWEMLAARRFFGEKGDIDVLRELIRGPEIPRLGDVVPGMDPALERVVAKALANDVHERYASALELRQALAEAAPRAALVDASGIAAMVRAAFDGPIPRPIAPAGVVPAIQVTFAEAPTASSAKRRAGAVADGAVNAAPTPAPAVAPRSTVRWIATGAVVVIAAAVAAALGMASSEPTSVASPVVPLTPVAAEPARPPEIAPAPTVAVVPAAPPPEAATVDVAPVVAPPPEAPREELPASTTRRSRGSRAHHELIDGVPIADDGAF
ncbi:serine/threonine-protein kinase [Sandaracinus amylolyticus]|uniref:serine/threonine-protein kinase n=1 Tax=Sandaracinus amylolyticus TaxID=927083 RepID=UPI001F45212C|nr:serine/threonine-protein kinase [Sandaracinus amylolyticus]UJR82348.1 Hypothetical protein I5071_44130 [Sandaracinus amylolyticus]